MILFELNWGQKYAMSLEDATAFIKILERSFSYEEKDKNGTKSIHAYPVDKEFRFATLSNDTFKLAKLAGKPEEK
jgi:hypothetical protein